MKDLALGLQVPKTTPIGSPSFTLIQEYAGRLPLYHIDLYRLEHESELLELGLAELADKGGVIAIEWLSKFPTYIPNEYLKISLSFGPTRNQRVLSLEAQGISSEKLLATWIESFPSSPC